jgi:hypothetical protein
LNQGRKAWPKGFPREAHADLPVLPPIPTQKGQTVVIGVTRGTAKGEGEQPESPE